MMTLVPLILFATATTLVVAHPMPHLKGKGGLTPGGFPCMEGIEPPPDFKQAIKVCFAKTDTLMKKLYKDYKTDFPTRKMIEEIMEQRDEMFAECMIDNLGYENQDGSLDLAKFIREGIEKLSAPNFVIRIRVISMAKQCVENVTGFNSSQQFINVNRCLQQSMVDYCSQEESYLEMFLDRQNTTSACAPVANYTAKSEVNKAVMDCIAQPEAGTTYAFTVNDPGRFGGQRGGQGGQRSHTGRGHHGDRGTWQNQHMNAVDNRNKAIEKTASTVMCVSRKMGLYSNDTGYNFTAFREEVRNLPGWERIPNVLDSVIRAYDSCESKYNGDHGMQGYLWETCLMPKIVDICGFDNNVTNALFPLHTLEISQETIMYARRELGLKATDDEFFGIIRNVYNDDGVSSEGGRWSNRNRERRSKNSKESSDTDFMAFPGSDDTSEEFVDFPLETTLPSLIIP